MQNRHFATLLVLLAMLGASLDARAQSIDAARDARDKAKADLIRAQEAFDRADEAYIHALGGQAAATSAARAAVTPAPTPAGARSRVVTFSLSGPGVQIVNPLSYRGRVIVDGLPGTWTQHASGAKEIVPAGARTLAYEVQADEKGDAAKPEWKTICKGSLPLNNTIIVDIAIARTASCGVR